MSDLPLVAGVGSARRHGSVSPISDTLWARQVFLRTDRPSRLIAINIIFAPNWAPRRSCADCYWELLRGRGHAFAAPISTFASSAVKRPEPNRVSNAWFVSTGLGTARGFASNHSWK